MVKFFGNIGCRNRCAVIQINHLRWWWWLRLLYSARQRSTLVGSGRCVIATSSRCLMML